FCHSFREFKSITNPVILNNNFICREVGNRGGIFPVLSVGYNLFSLSPFRCPVIRPRYALLAPDTLPPRRGFFACNLRIIAAASAAAITVFINRPSLPDRFLSITRERRAA
ncbi:hypothetical protein, partial [Escherichia coli]|uniref:hypothetical protein n=1 Tax=Escherichia coli TaxID=562 RepID=UPI001BC89C76